MRFFLEWARLVIHAHIAIRVGLIILTPILLFGVRTPVQVSVVIVGFGRLDVPPFPAGVLLVGIIFVVAALLTAGPAWVRSQSPVLWLAEHLDEDVTYKAFRLRVENRSETPTEAQVWVTAVVADDGSPLLTGGVLPFELQWSHEGGDARPRLTRDTPRTVGVMQSVGDGQFVLGGARFAPTIVTRILGPQAELIREHPVCIRLRATALDARHVERAFRIQPNRDAPLHHTVALISPNDEVFRLTA